MRGNLSFAIFECFPPILRADKLPHNEWTREQNKIDRNVKKKERERDKSPEKKERLVDYSNSENVN